MVHFLFVYSTLSFYFLFIYTFIVTCMHIPCFCLSEACPTRRDIFKDVLPSDSNNSLSGASSVRWPLGHHCAVRPEKGQSQTSHPSMHVPNVPRLRSGIPPLQVPSSGWGAVPKDDSRTVPDVRSRDRLPSTTVSSSYASPYEPLKGLESLSYLQGTVTHLDTKHV